MIAADRFASFGYDWLNDCQLYNVLCTSAAVRKDCGRAAEGMCGRKLNKAFLGTFDVLDFSTIVIYIYIYIEREREREM